MTITVMYSCFGCGVVKEKLEVPAREDEGVLTWTNLTVRRIADDHRKKFPDCQAKTLSELWIPATGASKVGGRWRTDDGGVVPDVSSPVRAGAAEGLCELSRANAAG